MYFFVSIRFYIRYFYDFPLSLYVHEKVFYEKKSQSIIFWLNVKINN